MSGDSEDLHAAEQAQHDDDECKIFVSRIPTAFQEATVTRILEERLGEESVTEVAFVYAHTDDQTEDNDKKGETTHRSSGDHNKKEKDDGNEQHRGFAFVTLASIEKQKEALALGTVRGGVKATSTKRHTMYLRPVVRNEQDDEQQKETCYLWTARRCPYGDECKFAHEGEGACLPATAESPKKKKCFAFRKGNCKSGEACPFSHDVQVSKKAEPPKDRPDSEKDCINWKTKGKCRKGDKCPYRHDEVVRKNALEKKERKRRNQDDGGRTEKDRQPLSIRVFGLNYDTDEHDVRAYFEHCGPIVELTFPRFEDSGRSKGYCGILFQSPKAVAKAVELDGKELHGRWLSVQAGKMYLKKWEEQHQSRKEGNEEQPDDEPAVGEFGQKVKKRKRHGYSD